jgi:hypothetical protein
MNFTKKGPGRKHFHIPKKDRGEYYGNKKARHATEHRASINRPVY